MLICGKNTVHQFHNLSSPALDEHKITVVSVLYLHTWFQACTQRPCTPLQTHVVCLLETEFISILLPQNRDLKICTPSVKYLKFAPTPISKVCDGLDCPNIGFYGKLVTFLYEVCPKNSYTSFKLIKRHPVGSRINGPRQANLALIAYASSEGSGEPGHPRSLARTSAARSYKHWVKRNIQTKSQIPSPSEWLGMRS